MQTKTLREEMSPLEMLEELKKNLGTEGFHTHSLKEMVQGMANGIPDDLDMGFFGGRHEAAFIGTLETLAHKFFDDVVSLWQAMTLRHYQETMWPKVTAEVAAEVVKLSSEGDLMAAAERIEAFNNLSRHDLDNQEIGRTIIPERIPVSWGYL